LHPLPGGPYLLLHLSSKKSFLVPHLSCSSKPLILPPHLFYQAANSCTTPLHPLPGSHICCHTFFQEASFCATLLHPLLRKPHLLPHPNKNDKLECSELKPISDFIILNISVYIKWNLWLII
jgi:hypothetical protein